MTYQSNSEDQKQKFFLLIMFRKESISLKLADNHFRNVISFLQKRKKLTDKQAVYLYLDKGSRLIPGEIKISDLAKEVNERMRQKEKETRENHCDKQGTQAENQLSPLKENVKASHFETANPQKENKQIIRLRMQVYETF